MCSCSTCYFCPVLSQSCFKGREKPRGQVTEQLTISSVALWERQPQGLTVSGRANTVPRVSHCKRIPVRKCPGPVIQPPWRRSTSGNSRVWVAQGLCLLPWLRGRSKVSLPG